MLDVYAAREDPEPGVTGRLVADAVPGGAARYVPDFGDVPKVVAALAGPGDLVLTMGAGDITKMGPLVLDEIAASGRPGRDRRIARQRPGPARPRTWPPRGAGAARAGAAPQPVAGGVLRAGRGRHHRRRRPGAARQPGLRRPLDHGDGDAPRLARAVLASADVPLGTPLMRVDPGAVTRRVEAIRQVASATVSEDWPDHLTIAVTERVPVLAVRMAGSGYDLVDPSGVIVRLAKAKPRALPLFSTTLSGSALRGDPGVAAAAAVLRELTPPLARAVTTVSVAQVPTGPAPARSASRSR